MKELMTNRNLNVSCAVVAAAILCGAARAEEPVGGAEEPVAAEENAGWSYEDGGGLSFNETPIVSGEFSIAWDSKYLSYGLVDNNDPIVTPSAALTFFDWFSFSVSAIYDTTHYGYSAGYYNRRAMYTEVDPGVALCHSFSPEDYAWLPTTVDFELGWMYEHHAQSYFGDYDADPATENDNPDTQFAMLEIGLPDLWLEPAFYYERDIMRDQGTYLNLSIGHTFALIDGSEEGDDPILAFRPSIGQGWGDRRRVAGYLTNTRSEDGDPLERNALMDTAIKGELTWQICPCLALSGYVQYSDYIFDRHARRAAREYEATEAYKYSYNFTCGLALTATF